jgi:hypothetical protein
MMAYAPQDRRAEVAEVDREPELRLEHRMREDAFSQHLSSRPKGDAEMPVGRWRTP